MDEKRFTNEIGVEIILSGNLPQTLINRNAIYVSQELFTALEKRNGDVDA